MKLVSLLVARGRFELPSAGPEHCGLPFKTQPITWKELRAGFLVWCKACFGKRYVADLRKILDKHKPEILSVKDVDQLFAERFPGRRHLWFGVRNLLKYCEAHGWSTEYITALKKAMPPCPKSGVEKRVPKEEAVIELLKSLEQAPTKYQAFYNLILDSSIRPLHAVEVLNSWSKEKLETLSPELSLYHAEIERKQKHTWIVMITQSSLELISQVLENPPTEIGYQRFQQSHRLLRPKLVQKFAYNMMRRHGIDRDVAEFLSGRKPEGVGARHYAELIGLAEDQYPGYAEYIAELRQKALN